MKFSLLPSVNWNVSHMLVVNDSGTVCAYGSRGDIVIMNNVDRDHVCELGNRIITHAHKNARVMGLVFLKRKMNDKVTESVASCGDDGRIKIWDYENGYATHKTILKENSNPLKLMDIDYVEKTNSIICIAEQGIVVKWDLRQNKVWTCTVPGKFNLTCMAACPHAEDLVAIGTRFGRVLVFSTKGEGKLVHKLLCHSSDVTSVSWCPVPYNVLQLSKLRNDNFNEEEYKKTDKTFLLASCCSDLTIYVSKAGMDNHCETLIKLPTKPTVNNSRFMSKRNMGYNIERGRMLQWIYPLVIVTYTSFNEMISVYLSKFDTKSTVVQDKQSAHSERVSLMKYDVKVLHNVHKKSISSFAVSKFRSDEVDFRVWSYSSDRLIVRCGYRKQYKEKTMALPQLSGFIFCIDISPTNPDLLAIGTGDGKISVWDLSSEDVVDIKTLSKKIDHKVMSLSWHPHYEGVFAFGTYEGRVGYFDISQGSTTPVLFKTYYQKAVYRLCWAPPIYVNDSGEKLEGSNASNDLCLLAVVDGDILQYSFKRVDELPVSITQTVLVKHDKKCDTCIGSPEKICSCKNKSDFCYQAGRDVFVIGYKNGEVRIFSAKTHQLLHFVTDQTKTIMSLTWHPKVVFDAPREISPCCNWLAMAGEKVLVYDVKEEAAPKKIATLEVHTVRILSVAWSPYHNGRLLSCSGDNTAIVWDVINQTVIGRYTEHCAQVFCGIWSHTNRDIAITGSSDFTCRMWSVSKDTVFSMKETKKNPPYVEPTIVNCSKTVEVTEKPSTAKCHKNATLFPLISHEFHDSLLLESVFDEAISNHNPDVSKTYNSKCRKHNLSALNDSLVSLDESVIIEDHSVVENGQGDASMSEKSVTTSNRSCKRQPKKSFQHECNYGDLFGTNDQLTKLILQEERAVEEQNSRDAYVLIQTRDELKTKIKEVMEKNQVTEYHLALAASISPEFWKEACQVYIEQMIHTDNIFDAVNFQLAIGKDDEAVELLCEKKRFREAFVIARLRLEDESVVKNVLEKWIKFCHSTGSFRLAAHCYMYTKEEEKASIILSKSKMARDAFLAAKLLKYYQPDRALELAADCFKRNLSSFHFQNVDEMWIEFPELKFMEPWYVVLKYMVKNEPNTAAITKWVIGFRDENSLNVSEFVTDNESLDFEKLQNVIVDNTFQMNYEQLCVYASAQAALYIVGMSKADFKVTALRHFIRALSLCYNYRIVNSNQTNSDKAYPMARLLKLWYPKGVQENFERAADTKDIAQLHKSINAYFGEFVIAWLTACDELPKSLKVLETTTLRDVQEHRESTNTVDERLTNDDDESLKMNTTKETSQKEMSLVPDNHASLELITNKNIKLQKVIELCQRFLKDILDKDTVAYFKNVSKLKRYENDNNSGHVKKGVHSSIDSDEMPHNNADDVYKINGCLSNGTNDDVEKSSNPNRKEKTGLSALLYEDSESNTKIVRNRISTEDAKCLREEVEKFEKVRVSAPNPFMFVCLLREFVAKQEAKNPDLAKKLNIMFTNVIDELEIK